MLGANFNRTDDLLLLWWLRSLFTGQNYVELKIVGGWPGKLVTQLCLFL